LVTHRRVALRNRTDASPHTNYLFRLLKSDLHAGRRQKRNYNRHPHSVNLSNVLTVEGIWVSATGQFVTQVVPQEAAQFTDGTPRVNTRSAEFLTFLPHDLDSHEHPLAGLKEPCRSWTDGCLGVLDLLAVDFHSALLDQAVRR
jgi:hypothetical protein